MVLVLVISCYSVLLFGVVGVVSFLRCCRVVDMVVGDGYFFVFDDLVKKIKFVSKCFFEMG